MSKKTLTESEKAIAAFDAAETEPAPVVQEPPVDVDEDGNPIEEEVEPKLGPDGKPLAAAAEEEEEEEVDENDPESVAAAEKKAADAKAAEEASKGKEKAPADDKDKGKAKPAKEDLAEADKLQLKGQARERFVNMASTIREQGTQLDAFKKPFEGLVDFTKPPADVAKAVDYVSRAAQDQIAWDAHMDRIGLQPEQFGRLMAYGSAINSDDPKVLENAREVLTKELGFIDAKLGRETEFHDPLAEFPDLKAKVEKGAMDKEDALETARLRRQTKVADERREQDTRQGEQNTAITTGLESLKTVGAEFKARDGEKLFKAKMDAIKGALEEAVADAPPARWPAIARKLYEGVKIAAPATPPRRPLPGGKQPNRQQHESTGTAQVRQPNNALDAFDVGVEEERARGG